ncbi:hypothetical protein MPER_09572 [Moniliophthora perniciosa FA553]|nr:hypothetical protein MPER_09572 [Moniliophthora perniciosa FA553]
MPALYNSTGSIGTIPGRVWVCHTTQEMDVFRGHYHNEYILQDVDISISGLSEPVRGYTHIWNKDLSELTPGYQLSNYLPPQYLPVLTPKRESVMAERFAQLSIAELYHTPKLLFLPMPGTRELKLILRFSSGDTRRSEGASASGYITDPSNPSMLIVSGSRRAPIEGYVWTVEETNVLQRAMRYMGMDIQCRLEKIAVTSQSGEEKVVWAFVSVIEQTA